MGKYIFFKKRKASASKDYAGRGLRLVDRVISFPVMKVYIFFLPVFEGRVRGECGSGEAPKEIRE